MAKKNFIPPPIEILTGGKREKTFTISTDAVVPAAVNLANKYLPLNVPLIDINDLPTGVSPLGTPVFDSLRFLPGRYTTQQNPAGVVYQGLLINTVIFEANQQKNIVKTFVQGRENSIKEYISGGDISISITGSLVNDVFRDFYPTLQVESFIALMKVPKALKVQSKFLDNLAITDITIESWRLFQQNGRRNMQDFVITAVNDISSERNDITLEIAK